MMRQYYESMLTPDSDDLDRHGIDREMEDYNPFGDEDNSSDWEDMGPVPDPCDDEMTLYNQFGDEDDNSSDWEDMGPVPDPSDDEMENHNRLEDDTDGVPDMDEHVT